MEFVIALVVLLFVTALALIAGLLVAVPITIWRGYVLSVLWAWFIVPLFGLPALSIPLAIGLMVIVSMARGDYAESFDKGAKDAKEKKKDED